MTTIVSILSNRINYQNRALLWALLIALTVLLLLYPVHLTNEYHPIQAPYIFDNLWLFGILLCLWMLLLFLVLFSSSDNDKLNWESAALACIFGLGFICFWVIITPYGSCADAIFNMGHVRYLGETGIIPIGHTVLVYFDFPGMHLLVSAVSQISGLGVYESATVFLTFNAILFSVFLYILFVNILNSNHLALLGVLLVIIGGTIIVDDITDFYPRAFGFTLIVIFLVILSRSDKKLFGATISDKSMMLILFAIMVISYLPVSFLAALIIFGIYAVQLMARERGASAFISTFILLLVGIFAWEIYWTWHMYRSLTMFLPKLVDNLFSAEFMTTVLSLASVNVGERLPLWANVTRFFWWGLLILETIVGLSYLFRIRKLSFYERIETGGLLGLILLSVFGLFGAAKGSQFARYLMYAPLFCAPILLGFLFKSGAWGKRGLVLLTTLLFAFALPTFLSSVNTVSTDALYTYEIASGEFVEAHSTGQGNNLMFYRIAPSSLSLLVYYVPDAERRGIREQSSFDENELWMELGPLITEFQEADYRTGQQKLFVINEKSTVSYQHIFGIPVGDPKWDKLRQGLVTTDAVYNNGHVRMYVP